MEITPYLRYSVVKLIIHSRYLSMAVVMSGVIDIPSEEFWGWVQDETNDTDTIYHPKLDCCRDELTIN